MRTIRVQARAATTADSAFKVIIGLDRRWRVPFRGRAIRWTQRCEPAPDRRTITFTQVAGDDFRDITGQWRISPAAGGCEITFEATYDLGVPIYDRIVDPLVETVLADHIRAIIDRL
jgi:ribosome-associated toxin RatA of RatAB toxin-antitoxin module